MPSVFVKCVGQWQLLPHNKLVLYLDALSQLPKIGEV